MVMADRFSDELRSVDLTSFLSPEVRSQLVERRDLIFRQIHRRTESVPFDGFLRGGHVRFGITVH
jgi:hypothetical protein